MSDKPEERVRQNVIQELIRLGWRKERLQWKPEWPVPKTPHDLTKRERGQKYDKCGRADLVAFADDSGQPHALQVIFEFKEPSLADGVDQLRRYLASEPTAKMGYWTNGTDSVAVYRTHAADWIEVKDAPLPEPGDDFTRPPTVDVTWSTMEEPNEGKLSAALRRVLNTVVANDTRATRSEDQLRELTHLLLVKLQSDATASANVDEPVAFRLYGDDTTKIEATASAIREQFRDYFREQRQRIFHPDDTETLALTDETIFDVVGELYTFRLLGDDIDVLAKAFQIIRANALKLAGGQFLTPEPVIRPCVTALEIRSSDKVIDPACGTAGFLVEALRQVKQNEYPDDKDRWHLIKWANDKLYGVDVDHIGIKLTRAIMVAMGDGSTHSLLGDSIRTHKWASNYPKLKEELGTVDTMASFTVAVTNPPFGQGLKVRSADLREGRYTIGDAAASVRSHGGPVDLEIGLVFLEQCYRLVRPGGRIGIVLPETYFFSYQYRWLKNWLAPRLKLRGMLNIPMEAFEEFCRAKTNFYIFEKLDPADTGLVEGEDESEKDEA